MKKLFRQVQRFSSSVASSRLSSSKHQSAASSLANNIHHVNLITAIHDQQRQTRTSIDLLLETFHGYDELSMFSLADKMNVLLYAGLRNIKMLEAMSTDELHSLLDMARLPSTEVPRPKDHRQLVVACRNLMLAVIERMTPRELHAHLHSIQWHSFESTPVHHRQLLRLWVYCPHLKLFSYDPSISAQKYRGSLMGRHLKYGDPDHPSTRNMAPLIKLFPNSQLSTMPYQHLHSLLAQRQQSTTGTHAALLHRLIAFQEFLILRHYSMQDCKSFLQKQYWSNSLNYLAGETIRKRCLIWLRYPRLGRYWTNVRPPSSTTLSSTQEKPIANNGMKGLRKWSSEDDRVLLVAFEEARRVLGQNGNSWTNTTLPNGYTEMNEMYHEIPLSNGLSKGKFEERKWADQSMVSGGIGYLSESSYDMESFNPSIHAPFNVIDALFSVYPDLRINRQTLMQALPICAFDGMTKLWSYEQDLQYRSENNAGIFSDLSQPVLDTNGKKNDAKSPDFWKLCAIIADTHYHLGKSAKLCEQRWIELKTRSKSAVSFANTKSSNNVSTGITSSSVNQEASAVEPQEKPSEPTPPKLPEILSQYDLLLPPPIPNSPSAPFSITPFLKVVKSPQTLIESCLRNFGQVPPDSATLSSVKLMALQEYLILHKLDVLQLTKVLEDNGWKVPSPRASVNEEKMLFSGSAQSDPINSSDSHERTLRRRCLLLLRNPLIPEFLGVVQRGSFSASRIVNVLAGLHECEGRMDEETDLLDVSSSADNNENEIVYRNDRVVPVEEAAGLYMQALENALQITENCSSVNTKETHFDIPLSIGNSLDMKNPHLFNELKKRVINACTELEQSTVADRLKSFQSFLKEFDHQRSEEMNQELNFDDPNRLASQLFYPRETNEAKPNDLLYALDSKTPIIDIPSLMKLGSQKMDFWLLVSAIGKQKYRVYFDARTCRRVWLNLSKMLAIQEKYDKQPSNMNEQETEEESLINEIEMGLMERQVREARLDDEKRRILRSNNLDASGLNDFVFSLESEKIKEAALKLFSVAEIEQMKHLVLKSHLQQMNQSISGTPVKLAQRLMACQDYIVRSLPLEHLKRHLLNQGWSHKIEAVSELSIRRRAVLWLHQPWCDRYLQRVGTKGREVTGKRMGWSSERDRDLLKSVERAKETWFRMGGTAAELLDNLPPEVRDGINLAEPEKNIDLEQLNQNESEIEGNQMPNFWHLVSALASTTSQLTGSPSACARRYHLLAKYAFDSQKANRSLVVQKPVNIKNIGEIKLLFKEKKDFNEETGSLFGLHSNEDESKYDFIGDEEEDEEEDKVWSKLKGLDRFGSPK